MYIIMHNHMIDEISAIMRHHFMKWVVVIHVHNDALYYTNIHILHDNAPTVVYEHVHDYTHAKMHV